MASMHGPVGDILHLDHNTIHDRKINEHQMSWGKSDFDFYVYGKMN
jgi:hypothetical protein